MDSAVGNGHRALAEEVPAGYKRTEVGVIPSEWQAMRIGDLFESTAGGDFDPTRSSDVQSDSHPYPIYANGLSQEGLYGFCNYAENRSGSITVTARGTLGKAFYRGTPFVAIGRLLVLEPKIRMDVRYFSNYINQGVHFAVESTGVPQLTAPQVARYLLPVPPESEQRAIAEALSDVDELLAALEALIAKKRAIKQAAMQQLLTGKSRLPGFSEDEDWGALELQELCTHIVDGTHFTPKYVPDGIPFYSVENVTADDFTDVKYISESEHSLLIRRCNPQRGDILLTRIGSLGDTKLIDWDVNASIYVSLALLKLGKCADPEYIYHYTKSFQFTWEVESRSLVNAIPKKINMGDIGAIPIRVPPTESEQRAIATILSDMDAEIAALERRRDKTRAVKQSMMQQLLTGRVRLVSDLGNEDYVS